MDLLKFMDCGWALTRLLSQDTSPVCQAPGAAHWCRGVWFPDKVPSQGHESGSWVRTAEAVATLIQGTLLSHWRPPPHTAAAVYSPADWNIQQWLILSPEYLPDVSPVASDVENHTIVFFSTCIVEFVLLCAAHSRKWYTNPSSYCELCCTCHDLPPHPHFLLSHTVFLLLLERTSRPQPVYF